MPFKLIILRAEIFSAATQKNDAGLDICRFPKLFRDLSHCDAKVIVATTLDSDMSFLFMVERNERFFQEAMLQGHDTEEMVRGILDEHKDIHPRDVLYVDKATANTKAAGRTGIATCIHDPLGAPMTPIGKEPVATWNIHQLGELPLILMAQH